MLNRNLSEPSSRWIGDLDAGRRLFSAVFEQSVDAVCTSDQPQIDGYQLLQQLPSGGSGDVFYAVRHGSDRPCAVKILRQTAADQARTRRAWRELDVLQQLDLPFVPRLYDYGVCEGNLYFATEFIEGLPLDEYCRVQQLASEARVKLLRTLAEQVQRLHERGVLHRDLKPSNILVDLYGQIHIIDFGIAHMIDGGEATITEPGAVVGSPAFMAPEQARGERTRVSTRTDVYALGAVAFLLLAGEPPHPAALSRHDLLKRVATEPCRRPRQVKPTLPKPLAAVIARATSFDPAQRYASAQELADELQRCLDGRPVESMRFNPLHVTWLAARRRPMTAVAALVGAVVILLTVFFAALAVSNAQQRERLATDQKDRQSEVMFRAIVGTEAARHNQDFALALRFLTILTQLEDDANTIEDFSDIVDQHRNELSMAVLKATYGEDRVTQVNRNGQVDALLNRLADDE